MCSDTQQPRDATVGSPERRLRPAIAPTRGATAAQRPAPTARRETHQAPLDSPERHEFGPVRQRRKVLDAAHTLTIWRVSYAQFLPEHFFRLAAVRQEAPR